MYEVKIHFPGGGSNGPKIVTVPANNPAEAKRVAESMYSGCIVTGQPRRA